MIEFTIPGKFDLSLGPNRVPYLHWRTIDRLKNPWRESTGWVLKEKLLAIGAISVPSPTYYHVEIGLTRRQFAQKGDDDNYAANMILKVIRDQMAKLLTGDDDSRWYRTGVDVVLDPENKGYVKVVIE